LVATLFSVPKKLPRKLSVATVFLDFLSNSALSRVLANK
jgi:hypothetical protein